MFQRLTLSLTLIAAGFIAGLVVTGRTRNAAESEARLAPRTAPPRPPQPGPAPRAAESGAAPRTSEPGTAPRAAASGEPVQPSGFTGSGPDFTRVAGQAVKGVANISSLQVVRQRNSPFPNDPFFRYFFGDDDSMVRDRRSMSLGSGVIISADGYVITNNHV